MTEDEVPVYLNLEESGVLIHLLVQQLNKDFPKLPVDPLEVAVYQRMIRLYSKLCDHNDSLMGKTKE